MAGLVFQESSLLPSFHHQTRLVSSFLQMLVAAAILGHCGRDVRVQASKGRKLVITCSGACGMIQTEYLMVSSASHLRLGLGYKFKFTEIRLLAAPMGATTDAHCTSDDQADITV